MNAKLRADLLISRVETPEGPRYVIKDPLTSRFYRFRDAEYAVVGKLDGATPLETIAQQLSSDDDQVDVESLQPFVEQLQKQGLLEGERKPRQPAGLVRGTPLYLRFRAFNPDRLLSFLDRKLGFLFFNPWFVATAAAMIVWAVFTTITEAHVITRDLRALWNFQSLLIAWLAVLGVTTLHEFAHGLTCKHFGGRVNEMGFMLIYFQPALYCNISDAWLFPEKSKRLWVTAAGGFFELFVWSVATLVWTAVEPDTWVSGLALVIMATSAFKQFFNINPLIKMDGYYLLSDLLDVPNLRQRAFEYLGRGFRRFFGLTATVDQLAPSARERTIFAAYGLVAFVFSYWFLATIVLGIGNHLTTQYQGWGFAMFTLFLGLVFPQPVQRLLRSRSAAGGDVKPSILTRRNLWLLAGAGFVAVSFVAPLQLRVGGSFDLLPARNADLRATVAGVIDEIRVDEGDRVARGDTIAILSGRDYLARRRMAEADLEEKRAQLGLLRAGPRKEEITLAEVSVSKAQDRVRFARAHAERIRGLAAIQAASRAQLDSAEEAESDLAKALEQERARLAALRAGSRPEEIAAMRQTVLRSETEGQRLDEQLAQLVIVAPHGGVITTPRLSEKLGAYVEPGYLITEVHEINRVRAVISVSERDIGEVRVGQRAALRFRAYPDRTFEGTVARIAPAADSGWQESRMIRVDVDLPNPEGLLRPMMTGYGRIDCGERRAIDVMTRRLRRFVRVDFWSWW